MSQVLECHFCGKICKNDNSFRNHERCCPSNPDRKYKNGMLGKGSWNKGLSSLDDERIQQQKDTYRHNFEAGLIKPSFLGRKHTEEWREAQSLRRSINNKGGRCKWYEVAGQKVQGTWEKALAEKMQTLGLSWSKIKTNSETLEYTQSGKKRHYTPDFKCEGLKLEVKGFWRKEDLEKMECVFESHPSLILYVITKVSFFELLTTTSKEAFLEILETKCKCCGSLGSQAGD